MLGTFAGLGFTLPRWQGCDVHDVVAETDITMGQPRSDGLQPSNDGLLPRLAASGVASQHVDELEAIAAQIHYISQCARETTDSVDTCGIKSVYSSHCSQCTWKTIHVSECTAKSCCVAGAPRIRICRQAAQKAGGRQFVTHLLNVECP